jgi:hypothetical protein
MWILRMEFSPYLKIKPQMSKKNNRINYANQRSALIPARRTRPITAFTVKKA